MRERRVQFTATAQQHVRHQEAWCREQRIYTELFATELETALRILTVLPGAGTPYPEAEVVGLRRLYLRKIGCHVYYTFTGVKGLQVVNNHLSAKVTHRRTCDLRPLPTTSTKSSFVQCGVLVAAEDRRSKEAIELCLEVSDETPEPLDFVGGQRGRVSSAAWPILDRDSCPPHVKSLGFRPPNDRP